MRLTGGWAMFNVQGDYTSCGVRGCNDLWVNVNLCYHQQPSRQILVWDVVNKFWYNRKACSTLLFLIADYPHPQSLGVFCYIIKIGTGFGDKLPFHEFGRNQYNAWANGMVFCLAWWNIYPPGASQKRIGKWNNKTPWRLNRRGGIVILA